MFIWEIEQPSTVAALDNINFISFYIFIKPDSKSEGEENVKKKKFKTEKWFSTFYFNVSR